MSAPLPSPPPLAYPDRRPRTRGECLDMPRPCPFLTCRHHLALDVTGHGRLLDPLYIEFATPAEIHERLAALPHTCSLDAADEGPATLEAIGEPWGVSRERIRQIEVRAQADLARKGIILDLAAASNIDTSRTPIIIDDHRARLPRALPAKAPAREPTEPHLGMNPERMTAAMRRVQEESRAACPARTVTLSAEEIARAEAEIAAKRNPLRKPRPLVTLDTFSQRAEASRLKAGAATASTTRINATPAKAPTTTQPRQPSPPSPPSLELPPQDPPASIQSDDHPEVAVVSALPVDPSPTPPSLPMTRPDMRTRRGAYAAANHTALTNLQKIMAERGLSRDALSALARDAHTTHTPMSVDQAIVRAMNGTASPVSVWYRRIASLLNIPLSDLCADPVWLSAVAPEDSPVAAPHSHLPRLPVAPQHSPAVTPSTPPIPTHEDALAPLILAALTQAQRLDKRTAELTAVVGILRAEIDSLQQQLAAATTERDAATATLNDIKRRLA